MSLRISTYLLFNVFAILITGCSAPAQESPEGMVYLKGGVITIGTKTGLPNEGPEFTTQVKPFFLDESPVTVAQFREFTKATGYVTDAEEFGNSGVMAAGTAGWILKAAASWEYPLGTDGPPAEDDHPVTQVSWNDAAAYAKWAGKRLPTETEWEYAAKSGKDTPDKYSWGNDLVQNGTHKANTFQGEFPVKNSKEDGYLYTSPVGAFGETPLGLTDMGGNVWEWTSSTYDLYEGNPESLRTNPDMKVIRGGSFMCKEDVCHGYRVTARQFNSRESATFHMGFRTARDAKE